MRRCLVLLFLLGCTPKDQSPAEIIFVNDKAVGVLLEGSDTLSVFIEGSPYRMLGTISPNGDRILFSPAVPFQPGQTYRTSTGLSFSVPVDTTLQSPLLLGSFPSCDTVPSNLLKMYLQFSGPMSEGKSSQYVQLFDATTGDTVKNAFLDLQPELWNEDGTVLTLWLDPGRIKQDLIPNKKLGVVMKDNNKYRLNVAKGWRSKNGLGLKQDYSRTFVASKRDVTKPDIRSWNVDVKGDTVVLGLNEALDWSLLHSTISLDDALPKTITEPCERKIFMFFGKLSPGDHTLTIESRLEDLAGNNLNRLFETDVTTPSNNSQAKDVYTLPFHVK